MQRHFAGAPVIVVCDENTRAAGAGLFVGLDAAGVDWTEHVLPGVPRPKPKVELGDEIKSAAAGRVPVALGSGVINDLVKYAAAEADCPYLC
ncbi:MAG: glycerol-1-phosphate dehydrogenase, partial [Pseudomonadota bacterium]